MNIGFFASHRGSNMQTIIDACASGQLPMTPRLLISNNPGAEALVRAQRAGVSTRVLNSTLYPDFAELDSAILRELLAHEVELIVLAGYMKLLGPQVVSHFPNRILNIHPALLPEFGGKGMYGKHVHEAVIASGKSETGVTVHLVDEEYDHGQILSQATVAVAPEDNAESLAQKVLAIEHKFLVEVLSQIAGGQIVLPPGKP